MTNGAAALPREVAWDSAAMGRSCQPSSCGSAATAAAFATSKASAAMAIRSPIRGRNARTRMRPSTRTRAPSSIPCANQTLPLLHHVAGTRELHSYDITHSTGMLVQQTRRTPNCGFMDQDAIGWDDPGLDRLVAWNGRNTVRLIPPETTACMTMNVIGAVSIGAVSIGATHRFDRCHPFRSVPPTVQSMLVFQLVPPTVSFAVHRPFNWCHPQSPPLPATMATAMTASFGRPRHNSPKRCRQRA
jgi:hypothetical protein